jgi:hypothetical protein
MFEPSKAQEPILMKRKELVWLAISGLLALTSACGEEPAETVCNKVDSCGLLDKDQSASECIARLNQRVSEGKVGEGELDECAECVEDHSCSELKDDVCDKQCGG